MASFKAIDVQRCHAASFRRGLMTLGLSCMVAGCDSKTERPAPPTYPVSGKVLVQGGPSPSGGSVEFRKNDQVELTASGVINSDGEFSLSIPFVDRVIPGATEGAHSVYVIMPLGANRKGGGYVPVDGDFAVKAAENTFTISLPETSK